MAQKCKDERRFGRINPATDGSTTASEFYSLSPVAAVSASLGKGGSSSSSSRRSSGARKRAAADGGSSSSNSSSRRHKSSDTHAAQAQPSPPSAYTPTYQPAAAGVMMMMTTANDDDRCSSTNTDSNQLPPIPLSPLGGEQQPIDPLLGDVVVRCRSSSDSVAASAAIDDCSSGRADVTAENNGVCSHLPSYTLPPTSDGATTRGGGGLSVMLMSVDSDNVLQHPATPVVASNTATTSCLSSELLCDNANM